ncbi:MAG: hypothetical protein BGO36_01680 [Burkholderiales bacterium 68-10]|jgi:hypothetical protein|nr:MAG: hypothetical protein BGO36_01680 [Burkholderiales bacterium 68-10]
MSHGAAGVPVALASNRLATETAGAIVRAATGAASPVIGAGRVSAWGDGRVSAWGDGRNA